MLRQAQHDIHEKSHRIDFLSNLLVEPAISEYRWVAKKQKAMAGAAMGINHATNNATLTNPMAVADYVRVLFR